MLEATPKNGNQAAVAGSAFLFGQQLAQALRGWKTVGTSALACATDRLRRSLETPGRGVIGINGGLDLSDCSGLVVGRIGRGCRSVWVSNEMESEGRELFHSRFGFLRSFEVSIRFARLLSALHYLDESAPK